MLTYNIHEAKTQLSKLIDQTVNGGQPFIIAKAGKPMVQVTAWSQKKPSKTGRFGFMAGQITVPHNFNEIGAEEIQEWFEKD